MCISNVYITYGVINALVYFHFLVKEPTKSGMNEFISRMSTFRWCVQLC